MKKIIATLFILMINLNYLLAMGQTQQPGKTAAKGGGTQMMILFLLLLVVWWFLLIRPQQKKEKQRKQLLNELKKGDNVITIGGIYGTIIQVKDNRVTVKIADKTNIEVSKSAISGQASNK